MGKNVNKSGKVWVQKGEKNQNDYERKIQEAVQNISQLAENGQSGQIEDKVEGILDKVQNLAFMDGYQYAISVLEEGLMNMK